MTIVEQIKAELEAFNKKKQDLVEQLRKEFPAMFKELFEQSEIINSFTWTQYTLGFNDGDPVYFGVYCDYPEINGEDYYEIKSSFNEVENKIVEDFKEIINSIPEDFMEDLFGDDVRITINRNGLLEIEEYYDHD